MIEPLLGGIWTVTTASGATYSIDATDPDRAATIRRRTDVDARSTGYTPVALRRDGEAIGLIALRHRTDEHTVAPGLRLGAEALLVLEPLARTADVTLRWTTPVVRVVGVQSEQRSASRAAHERDAGHDHDAPRHDPDAALIEQRLASDGGARMDLDDVIRALGYDRTRLQAEPDGENPSTGGPFVIDVVRATSGRLAVNVPSPVERVFEVERLRDAEPVARAALAEVLGLHKAHLDVVVQVDSLVLPGRGEHVPGRAILVTHDDEARLALIERRAADLEPGARELIAGLLAMLKRRAP